MDRTIKISLLSGLLVTAACSAGRQPVADATPSDSTPVHAIGLNRQTASMPKAVVYKTNGDYDDNVMVTLNAAHDALSSFPDPRDITSKSAPIELGDGWLLDRRGGVGPNSAFLSYTYSQYAALPAVPQVSQLMQAIIPEASVTAYRVLPMTVNEAAADLDAVRRYLGD